MLPWFNPLALYEQCYKLATVGNDTEDDVFLYNCRHKWQQLIDYRLQEVSLMVAWGLAQPEPTIYYPNPQTPLMPPSTLDGPVIVTPPLPGTFADTDSFDTDAKGVAMTAYRPVLTRHLARLIHKTWGGSVRTACATIRLWDENCQRGDLICNLFVAAIFGPYPEFDEAAALAWLQTRRPAPLVELPKQVATPKKGGKAKKVKQDTPTLGQLDLL